MADIRVRVSLPGHVEVNPCLVLPPLVTSSPPNIPVEFSLETSPHAVWPQVGSEFVNIHLLL